uniref:Uncharacterized protein n=1 Tax=Arundo donax TaxID=35708 RepID=A0A0A8YZS2_ARUDO
MKASQVSNNHTNESSLSSVMRAQPNTITCLRWLSPVNATNSTPQRFLLQLKSSTTASPNHLYNNLMRA